KLTYELELVELRAGDAVARDGYQVCAFPVSHGVPAVGYALVEEERPGRFDDAAADALGVPFGPERGGLQRGEPVTLTDGRALAPRRPVTLAGGGVVARGEPVGPPRAGRTIVYTGDTAPTDAVAMLFHGADVLVHEATFGNDDVERAAETGHSTARQAGETARAAGVSLLALTHVSPRYYGPELLQEARDVFEATVLPRDFDTIEVPFPERGEPELVRAGAKPERRGAEA